VVVQCPNCQSRFRVADEKVSERGVRVRCSACKTVFAVRKSGGEANSAASEKKRAPARTGTPAGTRRTGTDIDPVSAANQPAATSAGDGAGKRLVADDLFGMSELTGESATPPAPASALPTPQGAEPIAIGRLATPLSAGFAPPSQPLPRSAPPSRPDLSPIPTPDSRLPNPLPAPAERPPRTAKPEEPDPFEGLSLTDRSGLSATATAAAAAAMAASTAPTPKKIERLPTPAPIPVRKPAEETAPSARRELVASALTGLVLAAVVLAALLVASLYEGATPSWLSLGAPSDVVATRIRSGLYETATGKPIFFVRGRVENRGKTARGPVRVVAELVGRSGADARAESIAGVEPSAEDVYALRSGGDADKLARALAGSEGDRRLQPGSSLPFFAIIADPPSDLARHKLVVRVEPQESPGAPRSAEGPR
jgi:predicted Zn finger-like uncharacterized protein